MPQLIAIYGPTASGKSKKAMELFAQAPESSLLISVDSRKVYKEIEIGTNKRPLVQFFEQEGKINKLIGINLFSITKEVSVSLYVDRVYKTLNTRTQNLRQIKQIILFGGSGLYMDALLFGIETLNVKPDKTLRAQLEKKSVAELQKILLETSPLTYHSLTESDRLNKRRLIRKIEIALSNSSDTKRETLSLPEFLSKLTGKTFNTVLYLPSPDLKASHLKPAIKDRVIKMIHQGWLEEVIDVIKTYLHKGHSLEEILSFPGLNIMGYNVITKYITPRLEVNTSVDTLVDKISTQHTRYAKQQISWARRYLRRDLVPQENIKFYMPSETL